jgi:hypothetical protein
MGMTTLFHTCTPEQNMIRSINLRQQRRKINEAAVDSNNPRIKPVILF